MANASNITSEKTKQKHTSPIEKLSENIIEIKNLNFYYDKKHIIKDFNLNIKRGQILSIFGPAKSGTTTILRILNRLVDLDYRSRIEGEILLDKENILSNKMSVIKLRRKIGMVFEVPTPLPMSVYDNVAYGLRLKQKNKKKMDEIIENALRQAAVWEEVKDRLDAPGISLSGGQQQRMCVARILALKPEVLMLDRSCSGLDPISTAKLEKSLNEIKGEYTIIMAPHNVAQVSRISDRCAFILSGELIEEGASSEVFSNPKDKRTNDYITGRFG